MVECKISMGTVNRILTVCVGILVAVTSVLTLITFGLGNISAFIMSIYYLFFAMVLVLAQFEVEFVLKRFHLLELSFGKFLYCLMLGLIMLNTSGIQLACAIVLVVFGFYHLAMILIIKKPAEEPSTEPPVQPPKEEDLSARTTPLTQ